MPKIIENLARRLQDEARRQVLESGYAAVSIRSVAAGCGVSVGAVYNYFPSKNALIAGFLAEDWTEGLDRARAAAEAGGSPDEVMETVCRELNRYLERYGDLFRNASEDVPASSRRYHQLMRGQISGLLRRFCPDDFTADFIAEILLTWTVEGIPYSRLRLPILKLLSE